jgi:hypothetical protein
MCQESPFWAEALGRSVHLGATTASASTGAREATGDTLIMLHAVPEAKAVKNRLRLGLMTDDFDAEVARLQGLAPPNWRSSRTGPPLPIQRETSST